MPKQSTNSGVETGIWPVDKVERWPIAKLVPCATNARTHSDAQVAQIAASIREWGWTNPVLVDDAGMIIAGHILALPLWSATRGEQALFRTLLPP